MMAHQLAQTQLADGVSAESLLAALSRVYRWLLLTDAERRVIWMSDDLARHFEPQLTLGCDASGWIPNLPRPEQVLSLRSELRYRSHLVGAPLDLQMADGTRVAAEVTLLKVESVDPEKPLLLVVARPVPADAVTDPSRYPWIERAPLPALFVDSDGFVEHANAAAEQLIGRRVNQLVGSPAALLFAQGPQDVDWLTESLASATPEESLIDVFRPDGNRVPCRLTVSSDGTGDHRVLYLREWTANDRIVQELRKENGELEHCVNALAHDLRSPLVALLGFSRLLRQDYGKGLDDTGHHFLDRIEQAGRTMEGLVHDLLELSRIGRSGDRPAMVDPRGVLVQIKAEVKPQLDVSGTELRLPEPPPSLVYCDRTRLYQLFSNLIGNALTHMGSCPSPVIAVHVDETEEGHHLTVRDNGEGIAPEHLDQIFDPFFSQRRGDGRTGAGMGLAIVKKIAEKHGGRAWVESEPDVGAEFHVLLPRR